MLAYSGGDARAFDTLYAKYRGPLFRFILRSAKSRGEAEELFQDTWIKVIEARERYTPQAKFTTWLYTVAHHRLIDYWRRKGLTVVALEDEEGEAVVEPQAPPSSEPARLVEASQAAAQLEAAIASLPPVQREAFLLHYEADMSVAEIAEAMGTNAEAAKSRLRYAMDKLRKAVGDG